MQNPFLQKRWTLMFYIISWFIAFCSISFVSFDFFNLSLLISLADNFTFSLLWAFAGLSLWFIVRFNHLENLNIERIIINLAATGIVVVTFINGISFLVFLALHSFRFSYCIQFDNHLIFKLLISLFYYITLITIYYFQVLYTNYREQQLREIKLQSMVKDAEITALKARINPHFLFNSLNSASSLTITNPAKAQEMIIKLAEYFRFSLTKSNVTEVKIMDEIENVMLYLEIEKIRFQEKLNIITDISIQDESVRIPALLLQPLFENAVKHGIYESSDHSYIEFYCQQDSSIISIRIKNNFSLAFKKSGTGNGLKIVRDRLNMHYGENYQMEIHKDKEVFEIILKLPVKSNFMES